MKDIFHKHGLSMVLFGLFILFQLGLSVVGQRQYNQEQMNHGQPTVDYFGYVLSDAFLEATMENWESEFLHRDPCKACNRGALNKQSRAGCA